MAKKRGYGSKRRSGNRSGGRSKSKYSEQEKLAFKLGQVQRGLKNPESLISESYANGLKPKEQKKKKSLY